MIRIAGHDFAAIAHHGHGAAGTQMQFGGELGEHVRINRNRQDTVAGHGAGNRPGHLDRPALRNAAQDGWVEERQVRRIRRAVEAEIGAILDFDMFADRFQAGEHQNARGIGDYELEGDITDLGLPVTRQFGEVRRIAIPAAAQIQQRLVKALEGGQGILGEHLRLNAGAQTRRFQIAILGAAQFINGCRTNQEQDQCQQHADL